MTDSIDSRFKFAVKNRGREQQLYAQKCSVIAQFSLFMPIFNHIDNLWPGNSQPLDQSPWVPLFFPSEKQEYKVGLPSTTPAFIF